MTFDIPPDLAAGLRAWIADIVRTELKVQLAGIAPSPKVPPSPYMTTAEAGEYARVSSATIRKWIRNGRLLAHGAGREVRVRIDDLVDALRPQRHRSAIRGTGERERSPEELADEMIEQWDGEREMLRRPNMTGDEALRLAGPLTPTGFGGREGARTRDRNKEQRLVREGKLAQAEFDKRQAERDRLSRLDRARRRQLRQHVMDHPGFYSVVRYCPDIDRGESVNVGVIVGAPGLGMRVRMAERNEHVQRRFGAETFDDTRLSLVRDGLAERLKDIEPTSVALAAFGAAEAGRLQISAPRPMVVSELDVDLLELFDRLVETARSR